MDERGVPGGALNLNSTSYPDHGRYGDHSLQGKIPTAEAGIEPGTSCLVVKVLITKPRGWSLRRVCQVVLIHKCTMMHDQQNIKQPRVFIQEQFFKT
jgi:hypothetical protein